jgi:hypothetical protein
LSKVYTPVFFLAENIDLRYCNHVKFSGMLNAMPSVRNKQGRKKMKKLNVTTKLNYYQDPTKNLEAFKAALLNQIAQKQNNSLNN